MLRDVKVSIAQLFKIIQPGGCHIVLLDKFAGPLMKVVVPLAKNVLAPLATMASACAIEIQKKMHERGAVSTGKEITLVISNKDMDEIRILKSRENATVLKLHSQLRNFLTTEIPLKTMKKCFLYHVFHSSVICIFILTFWLYRKLAW